MSWRLPSASRNSRNSVSSRLNELSRTASKQNLNTRTSRVFSWRAIQTSPNPPSPSLRSMNQPGRPGISCLMPGRQPRICRSSSESARCTWSDSPGAASGASPFTPTSQTSSGSAEPEMT